MEKFDGGLIVIENYLDGAVHDYERGTVKNGEFIESCILSLKRLGGCCWYDYYERMKRAGYEFKVE